MKLVCSQEHLAAALATVARVVRAPSAATTSANAALSRVLLEAGPDSVKITGFDGTTRIERVIPATVTVPGTVMVDGVTMNRLAQLLPDGTVSLEVANATLAIRSGASAPNVAVVEGDYPSPAAMPDPVGKVDASALASAVTKVMTSAGNDVTRPVMANVLLTPTDTGVTLTATDSYRLTWCTLDWTDEGGAAAPTIAVPTSAMPEIARMAGRAARSTAHGTVKISVAEHAISVTDGTTRVTIQTTPDVHCPDLSELLGAKADACVRLSRDAVLAALARSEVIAGTDTASSVRLTMTADKATITAAGNDHASSIEEATAASGPEALNAEPAVVAVSPRYLADALKAIDSEQVFLGFNGPMKHLMLAGADAASHRHLVMPQRMPA